MMRRARWIAAAAAAVLAPATASAAEPVAVASARAAAIIGERFDGYVGFAVAPVPALRHQLEAINIRRRALYYDLARKRGVTAQEVGLTAGCELLSRVQVGGAYMLSDQRWRIRRPGESVVPSYCTGG